LGEELGKGSYGTVYATSLPEGIEGKRYVVKKAAPDDDEVDIAGGSTTTFEQLANDYPGLTGKDIIDYNGLIAAPQDYITAKVDPKLLRQRFFELKIPIYLGGCTLDQMTMYQRAGGVKGVTIFGEGDVACTSTYSEYAISLLVATMVSPSKGGVTPFGLAPGGTSINFLDTFNFATCPSGADASAQYIFMERIDGDVRSLYHKLSKDTSDNVEVDRTSIIVQTLHAVGCIQHYYNIVHGDLHLANVFYENVTSETMFNGKCVVDYDYFEYVVHGQSMYIPRPNQIIKIGDWGFSVKYASESRSGKQIGNAGTLKDGYDSWIPNWYSRAYDVFYFLNAMHLEEDNLLSDLEKAATSPAKTKQSLAAIDQMRSIMAWCLEIRSPDGYPSTHDFSVWKKALKAMLQSSDNNRPVLKELDVPDGSGGQLAFVDPDVILTNATLWDPQGPLLRKRPGGKILLAGKY
jgi:serine/threonine protein kinase